MSRCGHASAQEAKRRQIMEAAVRAFARKGYHSPRIGEIAEEAGVDEDIARAEQEVLVRRPRAVASDLAPVAKPRPAGGPMSKYAVAHLDEIDEISDGRCPSRRVRHHFGITSFGVNAWTGREAGDRIINEHDEADPGDSQEELYLVQEGRATFELDGERVDAPAGTFVFARPDVKRTAFAEEPGTTIVALGGTPGKAYEVSGWEVWMQFNPLYQSGEYAEAADRGRELIEASGYAAPLYNLACCESLAGRKSDAIQHLRLALEQREELRSLAAEDSDLDPIRGEAAFKELVG